MKKILIPALLVAAAAFTPGLRNAVEIPDRACEVAQTVAAPLFWHLWNELLDLELARWTSPVVYGGEVSGWQPGLPNDTVVCIFFHVFLKHAFDRALSVAEKNDTLLVSIPQGFIRRPIERQFLRVAQLPAI
jgi:hypothetical protein